MFPQTGRTYKLGSTDGEGAIRSNQFESCEGPGPPYSVDDFRLAAKGAVAWIATVRPCGETRRQVTTMGSGEPLRVLDDSPIVDPASLRYSRGRMFWRHGEKQRSARLR